MIAAWLVGSLAERGWDRGVLTTALAMLFGNVVLYVPGLIWLANLFGAQVAIAQGLMPFLLVDVLKIALAALLLPAAWWVTRRLL